MIRRSAAVALAVTFQQLASGSLESPTEDQQLVLLALRRSVRWLSAATDEELGDYIRGLEPEQLTGVVSNVKGILHEMLVVRAENLDGDETTARLHEFTNTPGADIEFIVDGDVVREVQLKAVQSPAAIAEHFAKYPDIDLIATSEVYGALGDAYIGRVTDSGFSNADLTGLTEATLTSIGEDAFGDDLTDGILSSALVAGAVQARAMLSGQPIDQTAICRSLEAAGVGIAASVVIDALLGAA